MHLTLLNCKKPLRHAAARITLKIPQLRGLPQRDVTAARLCYACSFTGLDLWWRMPFEGFLVEASDVMRVSQKWQAVLDAWFGRHVELCYEL